jgi:hypothetical protein
MEIESTEVRNSGDTVYREQMHLPKPESKYEEQ